MSQPQKPDRRITGSSYIKPIPFSTKYKDYFYMFFTVVLLLGMLFGFLDVFARSNDVTELKSSLSNVEERHKEDYAIIDRKLDRILYHLLARDNNLKIERDWETKND